MQSYNMKETVLTLCIPFQLTGILWRRCCMFHKPNIITAASSLNVDPVVIGSGVQSIPDT